MNLSKSLNVRYPNAMAVLEKMVVGSPDQECCQIDVGGPATDATPSKILQPVYVDQLMAII